MEEIKQRRRTFTIITILTILLVDILLFTMSPEIFSIKSSVFKEGERIPDKYTCQGDGVNPMLEFKNIPHEARSLALVVDDPDAPRGVWVHWLMWNIDPKTKYIMEDSVPQGAVQGTTSAGDQKYRGPCPPPGSGLHHYRFMVFALDVAINLSPFQRKTDFEQAITGHILGSAILTGVYERK